MADGRHVEKSKTAIFLQRHDRFAKKQLGWCCTLALRRAWAVKILYGSTDLHKIRHSDAFWPYKVYGQLKFPIFENPRWRTAAILKNRKRPYLRKGLTDVHRIWYDDAFWTFKGYGQLKFPTFKNPRWPTAAILKNSINGHISATA